MVYYCRPCGLLNTIAGAVKKLPVSTDISQTLKIVFLSIQVIYLQLS